LARFGRSWAKLPHRNSLSGPRLSRALRAFIHSGDRGQLWSSAHHLLYFLVRTQRSEEAFRIWRELGSRRSWVTQPLRDELTRLLGPPGEGTLSDDELIERIVEVLDTLDREARDRGESLDNREGFGGFCSC
jgi:hypothetical protein